MALPPNHTRKQHLVPDFLLRNFADNNERLWVFNKATGQKFCKATKEIALESYYYDFFDESGEEQTLEYALGKIESPSAIIISKIVSEGSLKNFTEDDRGMLACFIALQQLRVKAAQYQAEYLTEDLRKALKERGANPDVFFSQGDKESYRLEALGNIKLAEMTGQEFLNKVFILQAAPEGSRYLISDNPIVLHNDNVTEGRSNIGLQCPGIQIYFPLSPRYCLLMLCSKVFNKIAGNLYLIREDNRQLRAVPVSESPNKEIVAAAEQGVAWEVSAANVGFVNCLLVNYAAHFLMAADGDFSQVERLILENPRLKNPPRMVMS